MMPTWTPEIVVSTDLAGALIEDQFPALSPLRITLLGAGWDNTAFRVENSIGAFVFRFPRRQLAVELLDAEARLLPTLSGRLTVPIPAPSFLGRSSERFGWPFVGYPLLPGRTACAVDLNTSQRTAIAAPLGRFLAALHNIPEAEARANGAGDDTIARLAVTRRVMTACESLARLAQHGLIDDARPLLTLLDTAPLDFEPRRDTLVHGDLYVRHLLLDDNSALAGVIDWGDVHVGDPAVDLVIAHSFLPPSAHEAFRSAYGEVEELGWKVAKIRAVWHTVMVLEYAASMNDVALVREGRRALQYALPEDR